MFYLSSRLISGILQRLAVGRLELVLVLVRLLNHQLAKSVRRQPEIMMSLKIESSVIMTQETKAFD